MTIEYQIISQDAAGVVTRALPTRAPSSHPHGSITNDGRIGTTADLPISTITGGELAARSVADFRTMLGLGTADSPTFTGLTSSSGQIELTGSVSGNTGNTALRRFGANAQLWSNSSYVVYRNGAELLVGSDKAIGFSSGILTSGATTNSGDVLWFRDAANTLAQRNGTNAQISRIYKTFTSATNFETYEVDAASDASNYRIGSRIGSAGGTTRGLQLGSYNAAGTWTSWLGIDANGLAASNIYGTGSSNGGVAFRQSAASSNYVEAVASTLFVINTNNILAAINRASTKSIATTSDGFFAFGPSATNANLFGAAATLSQMSGIIFASGGFGLTPPSSVTLSTNGQFTIEMTSNTAGNLVYRGSDGTTRRMALTFS